MDGSNHGLSRLSMDGSSHGRGAKEPLAPVELWLWTASVHTSGLESGAKSLSPTAAAPAAVTDVSKR